MSSDSVPRVLLGGPSSNSVVSGSASPPLVVTNPGIIKQFQADSASEKSGSTEKEPLRLEPKPLQKLLLKPLAPLAPKKQLLPKLLPAQPKNSAKNTVNTSKQWVLPPRPRPGRKSTDTTPTPSDPDHLSTSASTPPSTTQNNNGNSTSFDIHKKQTKIRKNSKTTKKSPGETPDASGNFELKLQLQNATEENENLRKIINKLNREIEMLKLVKLENKSSHKLSSVPEESSTDRIISDLSPTIDPLKINYGLSSKRLKRFNSDVGYTSGIGLNGNTLDDAGFYNADNLMPADLLLSQTPKSIDVNRPRSTRLLKSKSVPNEGLLLDVMNNNTASSAFKREKCSVCGSLSSCNCYEATLDLFRSRDQLLSINKLNIKQEDNNSLIPEFAIPAAQQQQQQQVKLSRTTDIIGDLGKNFIKNEMDMDMSFFVKPDEQDIDDFMMI